MGGTIINHMLYADDICTVSLSSSRLQKLLNICHGYCELHDLTFSAKKSMCMYFSIDINKHCGLPVIYLDNCVCQFVKEFKYLGVMIHSSMKTAGQTRLIHIALTKLVFMQNFDSPRAVFINEPCNFSSSVSCLSGKPTHSSTSIS